MMMDKTTIYFGLDQNGKEIPEDQFYKFIKGRVEPKIDSFTIIDGTGFWGGKVEKCKLLTIVGIVSNTNKETINLICSEYCLIFDQACVLVTCEKVDFNLYGK